MRKPLILIAVLGLAVAGVALAQSAGSKTFTGVYAVPTSVTDGIDLSGAAGWQVILSADAGETFTGGGAAQCYHYGVVQSSGSTGTAVTRRWMRCRTEFDVVPTAVRDYPSLDFISVVGMGRVAYVPFALGIIRTDGGVRDGGGSITIEVRARP